VFNVSEAYLAMGPSRPVLSLSWHKRGDEGWTTARLRNLGDKTALGGRLPPWFSNLLPEGALRTLVERGIGVGDHQEFDVLAVLGRDLPGAVVVHDETGTYSDDEPAVGPEFSGADPSELPDVRFSLAGVQLKLSMSASRSHLTLPWRVGTGHVIVKLPNPRFPNMPEAEFSAMKLAEAAGVNVADCRLVPMERVGVPEAWRRHGAYAFVVDRFDRIVGSDGVERRHMEDFAQILEAVGDQKYTKSNEETNLRVVKRFCDAGPQAVLQVVRRIAANILLGNGDAHLKNWSLSIEGQGARLSPAYDIFPTRLYGDDTSLALSSGGTRTATLVGLHKFERAAGYVGMDSRALAREVRETVEKAADTWPGLLKTLPLRKSVD
jgi:serine/threonine-protein kinase HipA